VGGSWWEDRRPVIDRLKRSLPGRVAVKFDQDRAASWAVQIAWSSLLAFFPIILIAVAVLGYLLNLAGQGGDEVRRSVSAIFPDADAQKQVQDVLLHYKQQSGIFAVVGLGGLLLSGSALFGTMDHAFATVYRVRPRALLPQRLMSVGMIGLFTALIGLDLASSSLLPALKNLGGFIPHGLTTGPLAFVLQLLLGVVAGFVAFAVIYFVVPNRRQRWTDVVPGALLSGVLLEGVTLIFPLYLSLNRGTAAYGKTFGLFFVLMTFFFALGLVTMLGAEVNSVLHGVDPEPAARARKLGSEQTPDDALAVAAASADNRGHRAAPRGLKTVLGAGIIGWAIGVATARRMAR
jgi:membrane protein